MQKARHAFRVSRLQSGFTIYELMLTLALAAVLVGIATPNMRSFNQNNRLTTASNDLLRAFQMARSESITRQRTIVVCASNNPTDDAANCSYGTFTGWITFEDNNNNWQRDAGDMILDQSNALPDALTVRTDNDAILSFNPTGFANVAAVRAPSSRIVICDERGTEAERVGGPSVGARALVITPTGRARVVRLASEVQDAAGDIGVTCP